MRNQKQTSGRLRDYYTEKSPKGGDWSKVPSAVGMEEFSQTNKGRHSKRASLLGFGSSSWHYSQKLGMYPTSTEVRKVPCSLFG